MLDKQAITSVPIHELLARRFSPRAFDPTRPVSPAAVAALLEAARWAPSCYGDQPWRFLVWNRSDDPQGWQAAFDCLAEGNQVWVKDVPVLLAALALPTFRHNGQPNRWAQYDTGAAAMSLALQAVALGLAAHQMGGFDAQRLKTTFGVPAEVMPMAMIAVGYQGDPARLSGELREREMAPRTRLSLGEIAFQGRWGTPFAAA
ncbi:nitroreductase family protein [Thiobacter aerophilum]|uniref:Nitroreductase family protein n=1 Tax=Thiobacter aerophilum TaxID=3121275 RepID=A0ABV0EH62_9BURK